jgi:hypothetical protein
VSLVYSRLQFMTIRRGEWVLKVDEKFSNLTCSASLTRCWPRGLRLRDWTSQSCGAVHDCDINSSVNILRPGRGTLRGECFGMSMKGSPNYNNSRIFLARASLRYVLITYARTIYSACITRRNNNNREFMSTC